VALEFSELMMRTMALAIRHQRLSKGTVVLNFHPDTKHAGALILNPDCCQWYKGGYTGNRDITVNMTADDETLKQMTNELF